MRVRVISQTFTDLWRNRSMMNPFKSGFYAIELISHKVFRYAVPLFLILSISSFVLAFHSIFFALISVLQIGFYPIAFFAWILERMDISLGIFSIPLYFVLTNLASLIGFYKFLSGEQYARWEPIRESNENIEQTT